MVWAAPELGAGTAVRMGMQSPPHRANLLNSRWREIGLAAVSSSPAPGTYRDSAVTVVTRSKLTERWYPEHR